VTANQLYEGAIEDFVAQQKEKENLQEQLESSHR
jgi:hypothetical protein